MHLALLLLLVLHVHELYDSEQRRFLERSLAPIV